MLSSSSVGNRACKLFVYTCLLSHVPARATSALSLVYARTGLNPGQSARAAGPRRGPPRQLLAQFLAVARLLALRGRVFRVRVLRAQRQSALGEERLADAVQRI